jgi:imidazolonepropionase-like amidohydrolase
MLLSAVAPAQQVVVFTGVNAIPMDSNRLLKNQAVVVRDGKIADIGPVGKVKLPDGALRVDGAGKYLMPGFAEMHGHLPGPTMSSDVMEDVMFLYLANGVTTVRGMLGHPSQLELRKRVAAGEVAGPALYLAGPALSGQTTKTPEDAVRAVREQKAAGYDLIKVQEGLSAETYDALVKTAREVGIPFGGHVPNTVSVHQAIEARQSSIDHMDNYLEALEKDESRIPALAQKTKQYGVWIVPTMALWEVFFGPESADELLKRPELRYLPESMRAQWTKQKQSLAAQRNAGDAKQTLELRRKMLSALYKAGAPIMFGTDTPQVFSVPGFSIHREIPILLDCGMSRYDILRSGTYQAAAYLKTVSESGTISAGKHADLILLNGNPLDDLKNLANPAGVMARGRWFSGDEIRKRLDSMAARRSQ